MLPRICKVPNHGEKEIEYVCIFPQCEQNRFICSKCLRDGIHRHEQQNCFHILNNDEFYERFAANDRQEMQQDYLGMKTNTVQLNKFVHEIQESVRQNMNIIQSLEEGTSFRQNRINIEQEITKIKTEGFNTIDEQIFDDLLKKLIMKQGDITFHYKQLDIQTNLIIENAQHIKQMSLFQNTNEKAPYSIKDLINTITQLEDTKYKCIYTAAISNNLKYLVCGGQNQKLNIWNYDNLKNIDEISFDQWLESCKFTKDSQLLYVGDSVGQLYQLDVSCKFKCKYKGKIHQKAIYNIVCVGNSIILTSSYDKSIIKTDINLKQQIFKITPHLFAICGLDFHFSYNTMVSGSPDKYIRIYDGQDGKQLIQILNDQSIWQVLFMQNQDKLVSLSQSYVTIWNVKYQESQLEQLQQIDQTCYNISLSLDQDYIILVGKQKIRFYQIHNQTLTQFLIDSKNKGENFCNNYYYKILIFIYINRVLQYSPASTTRGHLDLKIMQQKNIKNINKQISYQ